MNYRNLAVTLIIGLVSNNVYSQTMDLLGAYNKAQERDPLIAAAEYQAQAGEETSVQGKSLLLPQVSVGANVGYGYSKSEYDPNPSNFSEDSETSELYNVNAQLAQPIYHPSDWQAYQQSKLVVDQSQINLAIARQDLILRVSNAYFDVLSAEENVAVSEAQTRAFSESLERAKLTFKVGTATRTDMLEAQARYDIAVAAEIAAKNTLAIARQALASIIGDMPAALEKLAKNAKLTTIQPTDMKHWVDLAYSNNLDLKLASLGVDISQLEVKKLKGDRLPQVDLVVSASQNQRYQSAFQSDIATTSADLSVQLNMPIYTGGLLTSRIREAEALRLQQKELKVNAERLVQLQTQQAYLNALNGKQQVDALQQALISNESALEATKKGVEVGVRTNLDLLDAQQQYFATQRDFTVAKYNYLITILQLKAAAGILSENDVRQLNELLVAS